MIILSGFHSDYNSTFSVSAVIPDIWDLFFLSFGIFGMYQGIEIGHPVYALLFSNLGFAFFATCIDLLALFLLPFKVWIRLVLYSSVLSVHFHTTRSLLLRLHFLMLSELKKLDHFITFNLQMVLLIK